MNPELPKPQFTPESRPASPENTEYDSSPETAGEQSHEREQNMQQVDRNTTPVQPIPLPPQAPVIHVQAPVAAPTDDPVGPTIANDDDLIEKEWVDKAKKIIAETQNDPYRREQEISKLQADYLRKRYGKELGVSN